MVTQANPATPVVDQAVVDAYARHIQGRSKVVADSIERLDDALRPFRALEWLVRGRTGRTEDLDGDDNMNHLMRGDLAELIATLNDAVEAKVQTTLAMSQMIWKA